MSKTVYTNGSCLLFVRKLLNGIGMQKLLLWVLEMAERSIDSCCLPGHGCRRHTAFYAIEAGTERH
eukprot:3962344-Amphidinium_carterae.1